MATSTTTKPHFLIEKLTYMRKFWTLDWLETWVTTFLASAGIFLGGIGSFLGLMACAVIFDTLTGIFAAIYRNEQIESRKMARMIIKIVLYLGTIMLAHGMDKVFFEGKHAFAYWASFAAAAIEVKSISENVAHVTGFNAWEILRRRFGKVLEIEPDDQEQKSPSDDDSLS
ncbi:MAG: phage holin family protein [Notoacmeibacter sp.]